MASQGFIPSILYGPPNNARKIPKHHSYGPKKHKKRKEGRQGGKRLQTIFDLFLDAQNFEDSNLAFNTCREETTDNC